MGALKDVFRKAANPATSNEVRFSGIAGRVIPAGRLLNRADGYQYQLDKEVIIAEQGSALGEITAILPSPLTMQLAAAIGVTARRERY